VVVEHRPKGTRPVGIVSAKDILHAFPPDVNPFAVTPPDARQGPATVARIMSGDLLTTTPDTPIEQAAALMAERKIGALPVVRDGELVGIITESDIFRTFASFFTIPERGARITFDMTAGEEVFGWLCQASHRRKVRLTSLISSQQDDHPVCVVHVAGEGVDRLLEDIWNSGHRVLNVVRIGRN